MTFIILEGVDGSGKSTLARKITNELEERRPDDQIINMHHAQLKRSPYLEYVQPYEEYKPSGTTHYVIDRHYLGEFVYGPLYRDGSAIENGQLRAIELWLQSIGALAILVEASPEVLHERLDTRGEDFLKSEDVEHVAESFRTVVGRSPIYGAVVDTTASGLDETTGVDKLVDLAVFRTNQAASMERFSGIYTGRPNPTGVIIADELTPEDRARLFDSLPDAPSVGVLDLTEVETDDRDNVLADFFYATMLPRAIVLGDFENISASLSAITPASFSHPRYWHTDLEWLRERGAKLVDKLFAESE